MLSGPRCLPGALTGNARQRQALKAIRHDSLARRTVFLQRFTSVSQCKKPKKKNPGTADHILFAVHFSIRALTPSYGP